MPRKHVYITEGASGVLKRYGINLPEGWYDTNRGTIGALLAREGVPNAQVGPATRTAMDYGCYVADVPTPPPRVIP
ncbi:MAG: hypothetical protein GF368_04930, partial [Candidatus Aenigmarchaeota archaeon]|nr:hypothetical protein [Candidatus Aenigmarchaeota archaeon]